MKSNCQNCGKPIESGNFCDEKCKNLYYKEPKGAKPFEVNEREEQELDQKTRLMYKMELDLLEKNVGKRVELGLSRGSTVRGTVTGFDDKYGKVAVEIKENGVYKTTIVKVTYIISFSIYDARVQDIKNK